MRRTHHEHTPGRTRRAATLLVLLAACGSSERPTSVLVVTLDTTRADALGGGHALPTPTLDALAAESLAFDAAFTVAPLTQPSHASMMTGLYPPRHGVRDNGFARLPEEAETVAERARSGGRRTAAFVGAVVLDRDFGLDQGFETYSAPERPVGSHSQHIPDRAAGEVVDDALAWLRAEDGPFFCWVHLFDPHVPYEPPPAYRRGTDGPTLYAGEVSYADHELGRLLEGLRADGRLADTVVCVVADHGEGLGDHGEETHGYFCWNSTLRVPFLLRYPDGRHAGERSEAVVTVADVAPTLLEAMGLPAGDGLDGESLWSTVPAGRGVYFESYAGHLAHGWSHVAGWIDDEAKTIHGPAHATAYDWRADPAESVDRAAELGPAIERHRRALAALARRPSLPLGGAPDAELEESLRALGYAGSVAEVREVPAPDETSTRPDPHAMVENVRRVRRGQELLGQGKLDEAEAVLRECLAENPHDWFAQDQLGACLIQLGRFEEAIAPLSSAATEGPSRPGTWFNLGIALWESDRTEEALDALRVAYEKKPSQVLFGRTLLQCLEDMGHDEEALALARELDAARTEDG